MVKRKIIMAFLLCISVFSVSTLSAKNGKFYTDRKAYEDGIHYFQQKNYPMAESSLIRFDAGMDLSLQEEKEYLLACCAYEQSEPLTLYILNEFISKYPESIHVDRIKVLIGSFYFYNKNYRLSISAFSKVKMKKLDRKDMEDALYQAGVAELKENNYEQARDYMNILKEMDGEYMQDAIYYLSYIDYINGHYEDALKGFVILDSGSKYAELSSYYIADCNLRQKQYGTVEQEAKQFFINYPHSPQVYEMKRVLGEAYYRQERYKDALELLQNYADETPSPDRNVLLELGIAYYRSDVYSKALIAFDRVTSQKDGLTQSAYYHLGLTYLQMSDRNNARMAFEQSADMNFDNAIKEEAFYNYVLALKETSYSAFGESISADERFLNEFPNSKYAENVSAQLIETYMNTKSYQAALKSISHIKKPSTLIYKAKQNILFQLGTESFANGDLVTSKEYFEESLLLGSYNKQIMADTYYWLGEVQYRRKNTEDAEKEYLQYQSLTQNKGDEMYALSYYNLGYILFNQKQYSKAKDLFGLYLKYRKDQNQTVLADVYNRLGDCNFVARSFAEANSYYNRAIQVDPSTADYALYQTAFAAGLEKKYQEKVELLDKLIATYPKSDYMDEALYEKGRAYVMMGKNELAIDTYKGFLEKYPKSNQAKTVENEMALLYYQDNRNQEAINAYKDVIKKYHGSDEANQAMHDLRSVYVDMNKVDEYVDFVKNVRGGVSMDINEQDSLTFAAAEKIYQNGNTASAKSELQSYLKKYPEGGYSLDAHYYLSTMLAGEQSNEEALKHAEAVLGKPNNQYTHETKLLYAQLLMSLKEYSKADVAYKDLVQITTDGVDLENSREGWLRSANLSGDAQGVIDAADVLLKNKKIEPDLMNEIYYCRAKAYMKLKMTDKSLADYLLLSKDTRNIYGAEAKYQVAQIYYDQKENAKAEKVILQYIDESTPHLYWLARSFVLLSDVYVSMNRKIDAKQYLLSLQQNYTKKDDIQEMINSRLNKLK